VLGSTGLIGNTLFNVLSKESTFDVFGSVRNISAISNITLNENLVHIDAKDLINLNNKLIDLKPNVIINCIGLTKHLKSGNQPIEAIKLNALFPHQLYEISQSIGARLIHISSDCVFSGKKGFYSEEDLQDAEDLYGRSKALGEISYQNSLTLRTSTIGHEINSRHGLLEWFLSQKDRCKGYKNAIFSGLPTVVFAEIIRDYIILNNNISGLYHIAATPIDKYELLKIIAKVYNKDIKIEPDESVRINRSLDASKFHKMTGYISPDWQSLIESMHEFNNKN
jgi:dTDP-4-dehydrorhamnose reductase